MTSDPYKYFRIEAKELLANLVSGSLEVEARGAPAALVMSLLRHAHTLKGAARVVKQTAIADAAHRLEDLLTPFRDGGTPADRALAAELLALLDAMSTQLATLVTVEAAAPIATAEDEDPVAPLHVESGDLETLARSIAESALFVGAAARRLEAADRLVDMANLLVDELSRASTPGTSVVARSVAGDLKSELSKYKPAVAAEIARASLELREAGELVQTLQLVPAEAIAPRLRRVARDAAAVLGKHVEFKMERADVRLDGATLGAVSKALGHAVRNAVAHGIESERERAACGKPRAGRIAVAVERRGGRVVFGCSDDGRGVDVEAVRRTAIERGIVSADDGRDLPKQRILDLLFSANLSTSPGASQIAGRGIGLDVIRDTAASLGGEARFRSTDANGTEIELAVPAQSASLPALLVESAREVFAIPLSAVKSTRAVGRDELSASSYGTSLADEGRMIPFASLGGLLGDGDSHSPRWQSHCVIVEASGRRAALAVDRLDAVSRIVVRPIPTCLEAQGCAGGAFLDAAGVVRLVVDAEAAIVAAHGGAGRPELERPREAARILVIDDSLTTRMLEKSILETAGYEVELATSAEEAMVLATERRYALFLVDVEMPGMDGFQFVASTRADPVLRDVPAVLVTSRAEAEDRAAGVRAGAKGYVVKGEFDQRRLLDLIAELVGAR